MVQRAGKLEPLTGARLPVYRGHLAMRLRGIFMLGEGPGNLGHRGNLAPLASLGRGETKIAKITRLPPSGASGAHVQHATTQHLRRMAVIDSNAPVIPTKPRSIDMPASS